MVAFLNGKYGLGKTYWFGVVGFGLIFRLVVYLLTQQYLTTTDPDAVARLDLYNKGFMVLSTIITLLLLRAVFKAAFDDRTPGVWGWIGIFIAFLGVLNVGYQTATSLFPSLTTPRFLIAREVDGIRAQLPQEMQPGVTLRDVQIIGDDIVYYITSDMPVLPENIPMVEGAFKTDTPDGQALCREFQGYFSGGIAAVTYEFTYPNETVLSQLTREECFDFLASE